MYLFTEPERASWLGGERWRERGRQAGRQADRQKQTDVQTESPLLLALLNRVY